MICYKICSRKLQEWTHIYKNGGASLKKENLKNNEKILGKLLYFSLSDPLIEKEQLQDICNNLDFPFTDGLRTSPANAFKSATSDIYERVADKKGIYKVYCKDNKRTDKNIISRELIKETLGENTNKHQRLANLSFNVEKNRFLIKNIDFNCYVDVNKCCIRVEELFNIYKKCLTKEQIEGMIERYICSMNALKISINGKLFFIPKSHIHMVDLLENFIFELNRYSSNNQNSIINSISVSDTEKQREKISVEFYTNIRKDIEKCQERINYLINSSSESTAIMQRWANKVDTLSEKKILYEKILKRDLTDLDSEIFTLNDLLQNLQQYVKSSKKCA